MDTTAKVTHKAEWKIHNFTKERLEKYKEKDILTTKFKISLQDKTFDCYFFIKLKESQLGLFVAFQGTQHSDDLQMKIKFWMPKNEKISNFVGPKPLSEIKSGYGWGFSSVLDVNDVFANPTKYLGSDNTLTIAMKLKIFKAASAKLQSTDNSQFFNSQKLSDVSFVCSDDVRFPAHKLVLSSNSCVMDTMFEIEMKESCSKIVHVDDIDGDTMREILRFMYTRKVENLDTLASKILYGAEKYGLYELKNLCVSSMIQNLSAENVVEYFILADRYNEDYLLKKCAKFIKPNYYQTYAAWKSMDSKLLVMLLNLFEKNTRHIHFFTNTL